MKSFARKLVMKLPGDWSLRIHGLWRHLRFPKIRHEKRVCREIYDRIGRPNKVMQGPFAGMHYLSRAYYGHLLPKILASYEIELAGTVEKICSLKPDLIIDIGAAEGYYAVGMAMRNPQAKNICFEMFAPARKMIAELAAKNGLSDRIKILGAGTPESLREALAGSRSAVVICDVEGFEDELMDPKKIPDLVHSVLLIEVHDEFRENIGPKLQERFESSHDLTIINSHVRTPADLPKGVELSAEELPIATDEYRASARWFLLLPKANLT
jgi:hypothetical protein